VKLYEKEGIHMNTVIQVASILLRVFGTLALILGLLFWAGIGLNFIAVHMLLGLLVVLLLWIVGVGQAVSRNGSWGLAIGALALGALVLAFGLRQSSLLVGSFHWVIRVIHLLLGILAVGVGQASVGRYKKATAGRAATQSST
jgi:hypothetical protein